MAIETVGQTEEMRHVPPLEALTEKLDRDVRSRIEVLYSSCFESASAVEPAVLSAVETHFRQLCRWLERMGENARGKRAHGNHEFNLRVRVRSALSFAIDSLATLNPAQFRLRHPDHYFERSRGECVYAAFLVVMWHIERLTELASRLDRDVYRKLAEPPFELPVIEKLEDVQRIDVDHDVDAAVTLS